MLALEKLLECDEISFRSYLSLVADSPHEVIEFVELFCSETNQHDLGSTSRLRLLLLICEG